MSSPTSFNEDFSIEDFSLENSSSPTPANIVPPEKVPTENALAEVPNFEEEDFSLISQDKIEITENETITNEQSTPETEQSTPETKNSTQETEASSYTNSQKRVPNIIFDFNQPTKPILKTSNFDNFDSSKFSKAKIQAAKAKKNVTYKKIKSKNSRYGFDVVKCNKKETSELQKQPQISEKEFKMLKSCLGMFSNQTQKKMKFKMPDFKKAAEKMEFCEKMRELEINRVKKMIDELNGKQIKSLEEVKEKAIKIALAYVKFVYFSQILNESESRSEKLNEDVLDDDVIKRWNIEKSYMNEGQLEELKMMFENDSDNDLLKNSVDNWKLLLEMVGKRVENGKKQLAESEERLKEMKEGKQKKEMQKEWMEKFDGLLKGMNEKIKK